MKQIDFLPVAYRIRRQHNQAKQRRILWLLLIGCTMVGGSLWQWQVRRGVERELTIAEAKFQTAQTLRKEHGRLIAVSASAQDAAELYAFLSQSWPKTQALKAIADCLPPQISLKKLRIAGETLPNAVPQDGKKSEESSLARKDLQTIKKDAAATQCVILIEGETYDSSSVHEFALELGKHPLIQQVKLESVEHYSGERQAQAGFRMRAVLPPPPALGPANSTAWLAREAPPSP